MAQSAKFCIAVNQLLCFDFQKVLTSQLWVMTQDLEGSVIHFQSVVLGIVTTQLYTFCSCNSLQQPI
jgi:hypothetical protein